VRGTIKHNGEIADMFDTAWRVHTDCIMALIKKTEERRGLDSRVAFIAGKKLGSAPVRNKAKRRMREAAALSNAPWTGYDMVFVAKNTINSVGFDKVLNDIEQIRSELSKKTDRQASEDSKIHI